MASAAPNRNLVLVGPVKRGRPSTYTDELATVICERIASGETLSHICMEEDMPDRVTVWRWLNAHASFSQQYGRAREAQADYEADEIRDIADAAGKEGLYIEMTDNGPVAKLDGENVNVARLRIETRRWRAERLNRRVYGNITKHEIDVPAAEPLGAGRLPASLKFLAGGSGGDGD